MSRGRKRGGGDVPPAPAAASAPAAAVLAIVKRPDGCGGQMEITPAGVALIESWAAGGATKAAIAGKLRIDRGTLNRLAERQPEVAQAIASGGMVHELELVDVLTKEAKQGGRDGIIAAMFLLKARHGWREGEARDGNATQVNIAIQVPQAMTREQYLAMVAPTQPTESE